MGFQDRLNMEYFHDKFGASVFEILYRKSHKQTEDRQIQVITLAPQLPSAWVMTRPRTMGHFILAKTKV